MTPYSKWLLLLSLLIRLRLQFATTKYKFSTWNYLKQDFPASAQNSIVAYDKLTRNIWIIGGLFSLTIYTYNIDNNSITDMTSMFNNINPNISLQFAYNYNNNMNTVIINRTLYFAAQKIAALDLNTLQLTIMNITFPNSKCMVTNSNNSQLYIAGSPLSKNFIIYDLSTSITRTGPDLNVIHEECTCVVINNIFYVIGGKGTTFIEYIDLNLISTEWMIFERRFPDMICASGLAVCSTTNDLAFIFGGTVGDTGTVVDNFYVLDIKGKNIITHTNALPITLGWAPAICVNNRIYIVMGLQAGFGTNKVLYSDLQTLSSDGIDLQLFLTSVGIMFGFLILFLLFCWCKMRKACIWRVNPNNEYDEIRRQTQTFTNNEGHRRSTEVDENSRIKHVHVVDTVYVN
eukprot:23200_1